MPDNFKFYNIYEMFDNTNWNKKMVHNLYSLEAL